MFEGHDPYLVALSVVIAILGGYTGFGLTARSAGRRSQSSPAAGGRRVLSRHRHLDHAFRRHAGGAAAGGRGLSGAADHRIVPDLRAGRRHFPVFRQRRRAVRCSRVVSSAVLLGVGIASMHYVGMQGLSGNFAMTHDAAMVVLSVLIAIATAYGGLRMLPRAAGRRATRVERGRLGFAVSGMHYTAMAGMHLVPPSQGSHHHVEGWPRRRKCCRWSWRCFAS